MSLDLRDLPQGRRALRFVPFAVSGTVAFLGWWLAPGVGAVELTLYATVALVLAVTTSPRVLLEPDALVVRRRKGEQRYLWTTILEGSWGAGGIGRTGPMVRTVGSPYATPGPVAPTVVASWLMPGREAQQAFADACVEHGVPYTPKLVHLISSGQRKPRLPGDRDREVLLMSSLTREDR